MDVNAAKRCVYEAGLKLVKEGLVSRTWGNISCRTDDGHFVITPSGRTYEQMTPDDIVHVNIHDLSYRGAIKPSSEKGMHAEAYKQRDDITAVIHTHQMNASTVAAARRTVDGLDREQQSVLGPDVNVAAYALPGTKKLKRTAAKALRGRNAALLANHGAVCIGKTMEEAFVVAVVLESTCFQFIEREFLAAHKNIRTFSVDAMHQVYLETYKRGR